MKNKTTHLAFAAVLTLSMGVAQAWPFSTTRQASLASPAPCDKPADVKTFELHDSVSEFVQLDAKQPTVVEFFWYGCSHCAALQPHLAPWLEKDKTIKVVRIPAVASPAWETGAQVYYALTAAGTFSEKLHAKIFDAVHKDKKKILSDKAAFQAFLTEQGLSFADVSKTMKALDSGAVKDQVDRAARATKAYKLNGTPTLVLENRYEISPLESNGTANMVPDMKKMVDWVKTQRTDACKVRS
jgi:thiol:disulfide interchange protein DsbA